MNNAFFRKTPLFGATFVIFCIASAAGTLVGNAWCDSEISGLNHLKKVEMDNIPWGFGPVNFHYNPQITEIIMQDISLKDEEGDLVKKKMLIGTFVPHFVSSFKYEVTYDAGMSVDPGFIIRSLDGTQVGHIYAMNFAVPGDGFLYFWGHTNNDFNERKKYKVVGGKLLEIHQPYLFVGAETEALQDLIIYSGQDSGEVVANIPKDSPVTVVLNDGDYYLLKTGMDILGWWKAPEFLGQRPEHIKALFGAGD